MNDLNEYLMPASHNLSSVVLKLQDRHMLGCVFAAAHATPFSRFSIRTCVWMRPQLYGNNASTFRKLAGCRRRFGRLSWSRTLPPSFTPARHRVWSPASLSGAEAGLPLILTSLLVSPPCFKGEGDTELQQELSSSWQLWSYQWDSSQIQTCSFNLKIVDILAKPEILLNWKFDF